MKISETPTNWVLIKAQVCSEWDSCNCALVEIDKGTLGRWKMWNNMANKTKELSDNYFSYIAMGEIAEFLNLFDVGSEWEQIENIAESIPVDKYWMYVEPEEEDEENIGKPEQDVRYHMTKFYGEGDVCFTGLGKHTSEEFYTVTINIDELTESL